MNPRQYAGVTVYDRLVWPDGALEQLLAAGEKRRELIAYLGEDEYAALVPLARGAVAASQDPARVVYLVPGIMGSQLGSPRDRPLPDDLLWIDPVDFQHGGLLRLAMAGEPGADARVRACGPVVYSYLRLKLELMARGCTVRTFDYDWRQGVLALGAQLGARLERDRVDRCDIVGHSMGGLVARAALLTHAQRIGRIVTLGTPHAGAFAPVQALRGVYALVRRLAQLDPSHAAEELVTRVFAGFPSLYDLLPRGGDPDWLDLGSWPPAGPRPRAALLEQSRAMRLPPAPDRLACIVGTGQATVTGASRASSSLRYHLTLDGDGTVPRDSAALAGHDCRYTQLAHSELPRDAEVAEAVAQLLDRGSTQLLRTTPAPHAATAADVDEAALRATFNDKLDWAAMSPEARRTWLDALNDPLRMPA